MKSYHLVFLVAGAGLAAGLAYKMTQLPPIPMAATARVAENAPPAPDVPVAKPSPIPRKTRVVPPVNAPIATLASAPETVYTQPPAPVERPVVRENETLQPIAPAKPVRKAQPVSVAGIKSPAIKPSGIKPSGIKPSSIKPSSLKPQIIKPKQWVPGKYESMADAKAAVKTPAPQVLAKPARPPLVVASIDKSDAAPVVPAIEKETPAPPVTPHQATLQNGLTIAIRLDEPLSTGSGRAGATFAGELVDPLIANGFIIAERGAHVAGRVLELQKAGRFTGTSRLVLGLTNVYTSDGQQVGITTERWTGLGDKLPAETAIRFRLTSTVTITERQLTAQ